MRVVKNILDISYTDVLLPLALILLLGKIFSIFCKKFSLPQVLGLLVSGLLIGLIKLIPNQSLLTPGAIEGISFISKIGVVLIMFEAGLETDLNKIRKTGLSSMVVTILGVVLPLTLGFIVATLFNGGFGALADQNVLYANLFYGTILTATSVSVTVATLKEMGKLNSDVGTVISAAAIIDDIIGVVILSFVISLSGNGSTADLSYGAKWISQIFGVAGTEAWITVVLIFICFAFIFGAGILIKKIFIFLDKKFEHHRRIPIFGIATAFLYAWVCEKVFGVADITGAFFCGLILSRYKEKQYVERRSDILGYMLFTPVFFANVGISLSFDGFSSEFLGFGICFIVAGILGKLLGCGIGAKITGFNLSDSAKIGIGMMVRAEVALITVGKGVDAGIISPNITTFVVILILITSVLTPILIKLLYKKDSQKLGVEAIETE